MFIKTYEKAVRASAMFAAFALSGGAFAAGAAGDSYDFEEGTFASQTGLSGNGSIVEATYTAPRIGKPMPSSGSGHVLEIAGTVAYTNSAAAGDITSGSSQVDFMFKVESTDELENPSGNDIHVALAVGTNTPGQVTAPIKLWCKGPTSGAAAGSASWVDLKTVNTGDWVRATLVLDYTASQCKVSLDGDYIGTYHFSGSAECHFVKSITMVGSTKVDELVVSHTAASSYALPGGNTTVAPSGQGSNVTYNYINKYGVTVAQAIDGTYTCADSGMTVAQKFEAGLDPTTNTKFELQTMTMTDANHVSVTFPGTKDSGSYAVKVSTSRDGAAVMSVDSINNSKAGDGLNSANVDLSTLTAEQQNGVLYFKVETK